ncbi:unnamed protein product [Acanthoscelides obtectus]|uniref:Cytochrome c oxidase assembly protein COX11, mitochondrial n=1 Tax=Acanthoscelides obtectus TaxID=200917 RepID=A0A9P0QB46_ACAOB|nr:unnamed protein product [Acanthoscelides obtectus]CAK1629411.1 Cytochrome c oxidase assembly protein COX11, mitochondrial [Acanthoscelides obtectus]
MNLSQKLCKLCPDATRKPLFNLLRYQKRVFHLSSNLRLKAADSAGETRKRSIKSTLYYVTAAGIVTVGLSYAAVPLYRMFCQAYSYGGTTATGHDTEKVSSMSAVKQKPIKIKFNADTAASMRWNFKPQQTEITVRDLNK